MLLFVDILNKYLYFFEQEVPSITQDDIQVNRHTAISLDPRLLQPCWPSKAKLQCFISQVLSVMCFGSHSSELGMCTWGRQSAVVQRCLCDEGALNESCTLGGQKLALLGMCIHMCNSAQCMCRICWSWFLPRWRQNIARLTSHSRFISETPFSISETL